MTDWRDMPSRDDEVRPMWGEREALVGNVPVWTPTPPVEAMTPMARALLKIEDGECPNTDCPGKLDDGACTFCGQSLVDWRKRNRITVEADPDYLPTLPGALTITDEFSPAQVDDEAAA